MSSAEPPSRIPPKQQPQETKSARDELSSKGKVEKVREVDPDEQTRKRKFLQYYKGLEDEETQGTDGRPSPFDLYSGKTVSSEEDGGDVSFNAPSSDFDDVEDAVVPAPAYTPPPDVGLSSRGDEDEATEEALPQSNDFWEEFDLPDQPVSQPNFQETQDVGKLGKGESAGKKEPVSEHRKRVKEIGKKEEDVFLTQGKVGKKKEAGKKFEQKKEEPISPFGPPGKPPKEQKREPIQKPKEAAQKNFPTPMEELSKPSARSPMPKSKTDGGVKRREEENLSQTAGALPPRTEEREGGSGGSKKGKEQPGAIEAPSLSSLPQSIQPMAQAATTQAAPYLSPQTASLFFQMVGTMFVMAGTQGVSRTEVVLNNPSYINSKFYGATITIEKYATAPDSFNIRLTGSQEAVVSFKENIPSLLTAFQNGNFNFRIGRIDVEYTMERPIFRRKDKGEDKGEAGGSDLGERRNK